jgi:hypothetical protein
MTSDPLLLTIGYDRAEHGGTTATIPAVPGTIGAGRTRREARDNVLDALREMLASPVEVPGGATREAVSISLDLARSHGRGHDR